MDTRGQPIPDPAKDPQPNGTLLSPSGNGATNWPAPAYNPDTGLFYVSSVDSYSVQCLTDTDDKPEGYGGRESSVFSRSPLKALNYRTGIVRWSRSSPGPGGGIFSLLTTAGDLLSSGDPSHNFIAVHPADGKVLWHVRLAANVSNGPVTYLLNGRQDVLVAAGDELYAFALPGT